MTLRHTWTCKDMDSLLKADQREPGAVAEQAMRHIECCRRCCGLYAFQTANLQACQPGPEVLREIRTRLAADLRPVSPLPSTPATASRILAAGSLVILGVSLMKGAAGTTVMTVLQTLATGVLFAGFAVLFAFSLTNQLIPGRQCKIPAPALITAFPLGFVASVAMLFSWHEPLRAAASDWGCTMRGLAIAVVASMALMVLLRRGAVLRVATFGATLGTTTGLIAAAALQLNCSRQDAAHLLAWHASLPVVTAVLGLLAGLAWESFDERRVS